jgi:hypothetical protein
MMATMACGLGGAVIASFLHGLLPGRDAVRCSS